MKIVDCVLGIATSVDALTVNCVQSDNLSLMVCVPCTDSNSALLLRGKRNEE